MARHLPGETGRDGVRRKSVSHPRFSHPSRSDCLFLGHLSHLSRSARSGWSASRSLVSSRYVSVFSPKFRFFGATVFLIFLVHPQRAGRLVLNLTPSFLPTRHDGIDNSLCITGTSPIDAVDRVTLASCAASCARSAIRSISVPRLRFVRCAAFRRPESANAPRSPVSDSPEHLRWGRSCPASLRKGSRCGGQCSCERAVDAEPRIRRPAHSARWVFCSSMSCNSRATSRLPTLRRAMMREICSVRGRDVSCSQL